MRSFPALGSPEARRDKIQTMFLRVICGLVLLAILVAGLWPFHAPQNEVRWLVHGNGLLFGRHGSIRSAVPFAPNGGQAGSPSSVEIWVEPSRADASGTILAFYRPESRIVPFALRQSLDDLLIQLGDQYQWPDPKRSRIYAGHVFGQPKPVLLTISSGPSGTTVYADGTVVRKAPDFRFSTRDLTGQLVVGNSPTTTHNWSGQLREFAIYDRELSANEAVEHYASLTQSGQPALAGSEAAVGLYLFHEESGNIIHNQVDSATDLVIPERFFVLHEQFLESPWSEFHSGWRYWKNVGVNIAGFVPLGFFFCAYFSALRTTKRAMAGAVVFGFVVSLTIEVLQSFLPTRDSGVTDLFTNTFGTALGTIACAWMMQRGWFTWAVIPIRGSIAERKSNPQSPAQSANLQSPHSGYRP